jgi:hypothetical protein
MTEALGVARGSSGNLAVDPNEGVDEPVTLMVCCQHRLSMNRTPGNP